MPNNDPSQVGIGRYKVTFNSVDLGYTEDVTPMVKPLYKDKTVAQTFSQKLGDVLVGVNATFKVVLKECPKSNIALAFPWWSGSGNIGLSPAALGVDMYTYAQALVLHPMEMGDTTLDISITKAVPINGFEIKADGQNFKTLTIEFQAYPDRAQLPNIVIGQIGT